MQLTHETLSLESNEPFVTSKEKITTIRPSLVRLSWDGRTGYGLAVLSKEFGMVEDRVKAALDTCAGIVAGTTPYELESVLNACAAAIPGQWSALAAVDMAMHDLLGKAAGMPLYRLWGLEGLPLVPTCFSLGIESEERQIERARRMAAQGLPILKLKMNAAADVGVVGRLRNAFPGRIWVDGNGCWDPESAIRAAEVFHRHGVEFLEQPIKRGNLDGLRHIRQNIKMPLVADEESVGPEDVLGLKGCVDAISIKLLRCRGLRGAMEMIRLARHAGLKVLIGCVTEGVLSITAIAHLAGLADYLDLDGAMDLANDPFEGVKITKSMVVRPTGPGLGVVPKTGS